MTLITRQEEDHASHEDFQSSHINGAVFRPGIAVTDFGDDSAHLELKAGLDRIFFKTHGRSLEILGQVHSIRLGQVIEGNFEIGTLGEAFAYRKPVIIGVVDPGVGSGNRRAIALRTENGIHAVGPDNGIFTRLVELFRLEEVVEIDPSIRRIPNTQSCTFDGRDLFAVAAGRLCAGEDIGTLGTAVQKETLQLLELEPGTVQLTDTVSGILKFKDQNVGSHGSLLELLRSDKTECLSSKIIIDRTSRTEWTRPIRGKRITEHRVHFAPFSRTPIGSISVYPGSSGIPELAVNCGIASDKLDVGIGDRIVVKCK